VKLSIDYSETVSLPRGKYDFCCMFCRLCLKDCKPCFLVGYIGRLESGVVADGAWVNRCEGVKGSFRASLHMGSLTVSGLWGGDGSEGDFFINKVRIKYKGWMICECVGRLLSLSYI